MMKKLFAASSILALLGACAVPRPWERVRLDDIPADKVAAIDAMPELGPEDARAARFTELGSVEGISCKRSSRELASWEDAVRRARYRAMEKGGNAIKDLACEEPKGRSLTTLCYESIRCTATAIQITR